MRSLIQSMPFVSPTPSAWAITPPISAATMPMAIVTQIERF